MFERPQGGERAILVGVGIGHAVDPHDTAEFQALAASAGTVGVGLVLASRPRPDPKYFVGSGKAEEIKACAEEQRADLILVDQTLTPSQERNLEKLTNRRVLDRNGLILDIFAQRARSFEGKLQVELAQLSHLSTRLVRGWTHLERQKGGIGLRGPGETQLETDRRLIAKRIRTLRARLEKLDRQRETGRHVRREVPVPDRRAGRLYQCRQIDAVQCAHRLLDLCGGSAVRHARSDRAADQVVGRRRGGAGGHRRLRPGTAARAGRGLSLDLAGSARCRFVAACRRCERSDAQRADRAGA